MTTLALLSSLPTHWCRSINDLEGRHEGGSPKLHLESTFCIHYFHSLSHTGTFFGHMPENMDAKAFLVVPEPVTFLQRPGDLVFVHSPPIPEPPHPWVSG